MSAAPAGEPEDDVRVGTGELPIHDDAILEMKRRWRAATRRNADAMVAASWLQTAAQILMARVEDVLVPLGLTAARYETLVVLYYSRNGALGLRKMSERLAVHPTTITYLVDQLVGEGLIERREHPSDRRQRLAGLTPKGIALVERALDSLEGDAFGIGTLKAKELREVTEAMRGVVGALDVAPPVRSSDGDPAGVAETGVRPRRRSGTRRTSGPAREIGPA